MLRPPGDKDSDSFGENPLHHLIQPEYPKLSNGHQFAIPASPLSSNHMLLYLASDLMWATRIKALADDLKIPARPVRTIQMLDARLADSQVQALIVDLEAEAAIPLITYLRATKPLMNITCFAPHVKKDAMLAAREAGASQVMPRGAFDANMASILQTLANPKV